MTTRTSTCINKLSTIQSLCRVCLTESKKMYTLDSEVEDQLEKDVFNVYHVIYRVTCIKINDDDRYPSLICSMCLGLLNISYKFKLQFEQSQKTLMKHFGDYSMKNETREDTASAPINANYNYSDQEISVELISPAGVFDLNDVFVIEKEPEQVPNYSGFLRNLGKEVSATFVNGKINSKHKTIEIATDSISIIDSGQFEVEFENNYTDDENKNINDAQDNNIHANEKDGLTGRVSKCEICCKTFSNKRYLERHVKRMHHCKKQTFVCEICGISLNSRSSYSYHMKKHGGKKYKCSYCEKLYPTPSNLQLHVMSKHTNERPHLCTVCGKTFSYSNALIYHMRIHTGERNYNCPYCGKLFRMPCALNRHIRTHTGHRPYACKFCDKAFRSKGEVDCHEMIHTGYRPYHCKYCNKGFTKTYNLKVHLMGHPGSHPCEICNKTFIEPEFLKEHLKIVHQYLENGITEDGNKEN